MPTGDARTAAACRIAVRSPALRSAAAIAIEIAAMASSCGWPDANAVILVGIPSSTSVIVAATLTPTGAACRSRIEHVAHTNAPNATTLTTRKLRTTLPVIE